MKSLAVAALTSQFALYPGFLNSEARVQAFTDKGPVYELVVSCGRGVAIISYSKGERLYCGPDGKCTRSLRQVLSRVCGH